MTLVDTNIFVDILTNSPAWMAWSADRLAERLRLGPLIINDVILAEVSMGFETEALFVEKLKPFALTHKQIPVSALFLAGKAFRQYRATSGTKANVLPDFFVGAHAQIAGAPILTRDVRRYRTYFPKVELITPGP